MARQPTYTVGTAGTTETHDKRDCIATECSSCAFQYQVQVRQLQPGEERDWDRFVTSSTLGTFFHLTGWANIVKSILGHDSIQLVAHRGKHNHRGVPN